ncbi:MAG TPA: CBS domain-containing protein [Candidatus Binataceae bacterium]|nr:CBS domain-containing protein [Candidatus Binataceae bacterium]
MIVRQLMTKEPFTVAPTDTLERAKSIMEAGRFRRIPVVAGTQIVGIISERDIRQHAGHLAHTLVDAAMTQAVVTVTPSTTIEKAANLLLDRKVGGLPVVDDGRLVGIVTTTDIIRAFVKMLGIAEEGVSRIDLNLAGEMGETAEVIGLIGPDVGAVLGVGTYRADWDGSQVCYIRIRSGAARRVADILTENGYKVLAVHS